MMEWDDDAGPVYAQRDFATATAWVIPLTFGRARIVTGARGSAFLDDGW